jgi:hypothetical protein
MIGQPGFVNIPIEGCDCSECGESKYTCISTAISDKNKSKKMPKGYTESILSELEPAISWTSAADVVIFCGMSMETQSTNLVQYMKEGCKLAVFNLEEPKAGTKSKMTHFVKGDVQITLPLLLAACLTQIAVKNS